LAAAEIVGPDKVGVLMLPAVILNIIAGWNLDTADPGFGFLSFMPLYQSSTLLRYTFYGSLAQLVPTCIGELFAWAVGGYLLFIAASVHVERRRRRELLSADAHALVDDDLSKAGLQKPHVIAIVPRDGGMPTTASTRTVSTSAV
jgi:hypothetical protein